MARFLLAVLALAAAFVALWLRRSPQPVDEPDEMQAVQWTYTVPDWPSTSGNLATIGYLYPHPHQRRYIQ